MGRACTVCIHPARKEIDRELWFGGEASTPLAKKYGLNQQALYRHRRDHLLPRMAAHEAAEELAHAESLWDELRRLKLRGWALLDRADKKRDGILAASAMREIRSQIELAAKLEGQIQDNTVVNIIMMPQWLVIQQVLSSTLEAFPEARLAVAQALEHVGGGNADFVRLETRPMIQLDHATPANGHDNG